MKSSLAAFLVFTILQIFSTKSLFAEEHHWLFVRGMARDQRHWADFPRVFKEKFASESIHFLDAPGFGTESNRSTPVYIADIREDFRERWLRLRDQHPGTWSILALSLGGMVALDWVANYPTDFKEIVVMNTSTGSLSRWDERLRLEGLRRLVSIAATRDVASREKRIFDLCSNQEWSSKTEAIVQSWVESEKANPADFTQILRQLIAANRFSHPAQIQTPMLVLTSRGDRMVNSKASERIASFYKSSISIHETAGHELSLDAPEWVREQILAWRIELQTSH